MASLNRFHVCVLLAWQFTILFATQMLFGIFTTYTPRWRCAPSANQNGTSREDEELLTFAKNCTAYAQCPPELLEFEESPFASAAVDFDWICGTGAYNKALYSQVQFAGVLVGTLLLAPLSDRFGRKPVGLCTLTSGLIILGLSSLAPNGQLLLLARFCVSFLMGGSLVIISTFTMEVIPAEHRMILRTFCNWGISRLFLTLLCFLFPDWRSASIASALCSVPAILILTFVVPESPTWLHSQGHLEKMRQSEQRIARFAGVPYVPVEHVPLAGKRPSDLVRDRVLFGRLLVLWMMWFTSSFSSYSIDLNSSNISGDLFHNQWLLSCPVIVSKLVLFLLDSNWPAFSRRVLHQCSQAVVCFCFLLLTVLLAFRYDGALVVLALNQLGSAFIQYGWDACYLCALEGMPTPVRSSSLGSCSLVAQFGALLAPVGILILLTNLFGIIFMEFTWDANVLSVVESMPTQMCASSLGSCSMVARVGGLFAPLLVFMNDIWAASAYFAVAVIGSINLLVSYLWLIDTKGVDLDAVKLGVEEEGKDEAMLEKNGKELELFLPLPPKDG